MSYDVCSKLCHLLLFHINPPCMNSVVTIHHQSILSIFSLDIRLHHFILLAHCTRSDTVSVNNYTVMAIVLAHTQAHI